MKLKGSHTKVSMISGSPGTWSRSLEWTAGFGHSPFFVAMGSQLVMGYTGQPIDLSTGRVLRQIGFPPTDLSKEVPVWTPGEGHLGREPQRGVTQQTQGGETLPRVLIGASEVLAVVKVGSRIRRLLAITAKLSTHPRRPASLRLLASRETNQRIETMCRQCLSWQAVPRRQPGKALASTKIQCTTLTASQRLSTSIDRPIIRLKKNLDRT